MTPAQFALAVGARQMWVRNARRLLGRPKRDDAFEAQWLGIVHDLQASLGMALADASQVADRVLGERADEPVDAGLLEIAVDPSESVRIVVDRARLRTLHELRLAAALYLPLLDQRGRPATSYRPIVADLERRVRRTADVHLLLLNARRPPEDRLAALGSLGKLLVELARAGVRFIVIGEAAGALFGALRQPKAADVLHDAHDGASLTALACALNEHRACPRGPRETRLARKAPSHFDAAMVGAVPALALDTDLGPLNLWTRVHVVGGYADSRERAIGGEGSVFPFAVLGLSALIAMQRGNGRAIDRELLFELRQLEVEQQRAARLERYRRSTSSSSATTFV